MLASHSPIGELRCGILISGSLISERFRGPHHNALGLAVSPINLLVILEGNLRYCNWPIATDDALTANGRFRGIADIDRFSSWNDL